MTEGDPACETPLHPLDHDARSKGELHSTGARPGGMAQRFPVNGRQDDGSVEADGANVSFIDVFRNDLRGLRSVEFEKK